MSNAFSRPDFLSKRMLPPLLQYWQGCDALKLGVIWCFDSPGIAPRSFWVQLIVCELREGTERCLAQHVAREGAYHRYRHVLFLFAMLNCLIRAQCVGARYELREMARLDANVGSRAESLDRLRHLQLGIAFRSMQFSSGSASCLYLGESGGAPMHRNERPRYQLHAEALNTCYQVSRKVLCGPCHPNRETSLASTTADNVVRTARRYCVSMRQAVLSTNL
jgi:hypothetical protein